MPVPHDLLALDSQITDCNAAIFDVANDFHGVIAGCHEILRRQGLLEGIWCLDPNETLGPGQKEEIDRVCASYPHLNDDDFVRANLTALAGMTAPIVRHLRRMGRSGSPRLLALAWRRLTRHEGQALTTNPQTLQRYTLAVLSHLA